MADGPVHVEIGPDGSPGKPVYPGKADEDATERRRRGQTPARSEHEEENRALRTTIRAAGAAETAPRIDCGYPGISQIECVQERGCRWDDSAYGEPWCFE